VYANRLSEHNKERMETPVNVIPTIPPSAPLPRRPAIKPKRRRRGRRLPPLARYLLGFGLLVSVVLIGQLVLHSLQTEPRDARALTEREIRLTVLRPNERVLAQVPVVQRSPLNYYRATRGVLMLTDQRLVYLGLVPRDLLASPDAPPAFEQRDFPIDTLTSVKQTRVFFYLQRGLGIAAPNGSIQLGASSSDWPKAQQLQRSLAWQHAGLFAEGRRRQEQARLVASARAAGADEAKRPRYHVVQRGEALASIARLYETTPERLQALNRLPDTRIRIGARIQVGPE
jgi:hypothetical protein